MFVYCRPEDAAEEHQRLLAMEKEMLAKIEVPYRIIDTAAGDLGGPAARKYDCEAWVPTQEKYRELTSTSNCTTYQARRLNTRYRTEKGTQTAATLNGTLATTRWLVAILENHQQADGSVVVPQALRPYLGLEVLKPARPPVRAGTGQRSSRSRSRSARSGPALEPVYVSFRGISVRADCPFPKR